MMQLQITCEKCNKPVDKWRVDRRVDLMGQEVHVECHGEKDACFVSDLHMEDAGPEADWFRGLAFSVARIAAKEPE